MDRPPSLGERALSRLCLIIQPEHCQDNCALCESSPVQYSPGALLGTAGRPYLRTECRSAQTNVPTRTKAGPAFGSLAPNGRRGGRRRTPRSAAPSRSGLPNEEASWKRAGRPSIRCRTPSLISAHLWRVSPTYVARRHCDWRRRKDRLPAPVGRRPFGYCPPWMASTDSPVTSANRARGKRGRGSRIGYLARCQCRLSSMRPFLRCRNPADARAASAECHPDKDRACTVPYRTYYDGIARLSLSMCGGHAEHVFSDIQGSMDVGRAGESRGAAPWSAAGPERGAHDGGSMTERPFVDRLPLTLSLFLVLLPRPPAASTPARPSVDPPAHPIHTSVVGRAGG